MSAPINRSHSLFKPQPDLNQQETSSIASRQRNTSQPELHSALDGDTDPRWYRLINRPLWIWRGINPIDLEEILAKIAASSAPRTQSHLLDTVIGYRSGNWIFEWAQKAMHWQQTAQECEDPQQAGEYWLQAAMHYSLAGYPHLRGDQLAEQVDVLASRAYQAAAGCLSYSLRPLTFQYEGLPLNACLHLPGDDGPYPVVLVCGGLDSLSTDYHRLFRHYLAPKGIAMLTLDLPSIGASARWKLTQDTSRLHQAVLQQLQNEPWVDHHRVVAFGLRFGANAALRLGYLEPQRLRGVACLGAVVHHLFANAQQFEQVPQMYVDMLASRVGIDASAHDLLRAELQSYSLKTQGLLGRRCRVPVLAAGVDNDLFSPKEENRFIAMSSVDGKCIQIPASPLQTGFERIMAQITDWIDQKLI
ncbi:MAG: esterase FrsA [Plesiomonas sp.]|uniref:esterase FrsA n=4 Tax=Plesiomonas sp. TaxID=2486279 RepID=UPI003F3E0597